MKDAKEAAVHEFPETQKENRTAKLKKDFHRNWQLYVLLIPGLLILVFFKIGPVGAMIIAFQKFSAYKGVFGSQWVGLANFKKLFTDPFNSCKEYSHFGFDDYSDFFSNTHYFCIVFE